MSTYRVLLARPGALRIAAASAIGWLAFGGYGLGIVLAVQDASGSFAVAGVATGAFAAGSAVLAPVRGRIVDQRGARGLLGLAGAHTVTLLGLVAACALANPPTWLLVGAALAVGATAPPLAATSRVAWANVAGPSLARTAHALNAMLGEVAALVAPVATSVIAATVSPVVALSCLAPGIGAAALGLAGGAAPPLAKTAGPLDGRSTPAAPQRSLVRESAGLRWLMLGDVVSGVWLAALEVAAAAIAIDAGNAALAGLPLAGLAAGGIGAALWAGRGAERATPATRFVWGAVGAAIVLPLTVVLPTITALTICAVPAGVALGLTNVALFELVDHVADQTRAVEAFTWITSAQASGLAAGGALAGWLADGTPSDALWVVGIAPVAAAVAALAARSSLQLAAIRSTRPGPQPS